MAGNYQKSGQTGPNNRPLKDTGPPPTSKTPPSAFIVELPQPPPSKPQLRHTGTFGQSVPNKSKMPSANLDNISSVPFQNSKARWEDARPLAQRNDRSPVIISSSCSEQEDDEEDYDYSSFSSEQFSKFIVTAARPVNNAVPQSRSSQPLNSKVGPKSQMQVIPATAPPSKQQVAQSEEYQYHLGLLTQGTASQESHEIRTAPIFTAPVEKYFKNSGLFSQYGFIAGRSDNLTSNKVSMMTGDPIQDPRVFFNISAPSSAFICGSQGSGKSHTLSCLLENCLMKSRVSELENPLAGLLFHYDSFTGDEKGTPCEAAYLSSNPSIKVRVLCAPTNLRTIQRTYAELPNVTITPLRINQKDLNTRRMLDLMAVSTENGPMPLYLHSINRILRELRMVQQETNGSFNYMEFKRKVDGEDFTPAQWGPLNQRLETLESFMPQSQVPVLSGREKGPVKVDPMRNIQNESGTDWTIEAGTLTILDLSCPCVTAESACALFNMCLSLFLEQQTLNIGRVIALDEAHKYMTTTAESTNLTATLLSSIRLQRHLGTRVFISTQEPTISPKLLDLCSITIVHRFTSPDWLQCLRLHLAALDSNQDADPNSDETEERDRTGKENAKSTFGEIIKLRVGEALLFAPSAIIDVNTRSGETKKLGTQYMKIKVRGRVTEDGGMSVMARGVEKPIVILKEEPVFFGADTAVVPVFGRSVQLNQLPVRAKDFAIEDKVPVVLAQPPERNALTSIPPPPPTATTVPTSSKAQGLSQKLPEVIPKTTPTQNLPPTAPKPQIRPPQPSQPETTTIVPPTKLQPLENKNTVVVSNIIPPNAPKSQPQQTPQLTKKQMRSAQRLRDKQAAAEKKLVASKLPNPAPITNQTSSLSHVYVSLTPSEPQVSATTTNPTLSSDTNPAQTPRLSKRERKALAEQQRILDAKKNLSASLPPASVIQQNKNDSIVGGGNQSQTQNPIQVQPQNKSQNQPKKLTKEEKALAAEKRAMKDAKRERKRERKREKKIEESKAAGKVTGVQGVKI